MVNLSKKAAAAVTAKMIDISEASEYFVSKDADISWVEVATGTYMYRIRSKNVVVDAKVRIDIKDLLAEFEKPMLQCNSRLYVDTIGANDSASAYTYITAGAGTWKGAGSTFMMDAGDSLAILRYYPLQVVELTDYKDEFTDIGFYASGVGMYIYLYVDRYIQLFEKG